MDQPTKFSADEFDHDEVDKTLRRLFAEAREPLNDESFARQFAVRKRRAQRMRGLRWLALWIALLTLIVVMASPLIVGSIAIGRWLIDLQLGLGQLLISRTGWACSLLVAAGFLLRLRAVKL